MNWICKLFKKKEEYIPPILNLIKGEWNKDTIKIYEEINIYLISMGKSMLEVDYDLLSLATTRCKHWIDEERAKEQLHWQFLGHGNIFIDDYNFNHLAENASWGYRNTIVDKWIESESHNKALLRNYTHCGIAQITNKDNILLTCLILGK